MKITIRPVALACMLASATAPRSHAQVAGDSAALAVAATERALNGRTVVKRTMAVLPFSVTSSDSTLAPLGYGLAEFLSDDLARVRRIMMVERASLGELQGEQALGASGTVDAATKARAGRLIAAQHMIFGALVASPSGALDIDERAVEVATSGIEMQHHMATSLDGIFDAERDMVTETLSALGITLTPAEKRALKERPVPDFKAFLAFSRGVRAERQGNGALALASFQEATTLDRHFALAATKLSAARQRSAATGQAQSASKTAASASAAPRTAAGRKPRQAATKRASAKTGKP